MRYNKCARSVYFAFILFYFIRRVRSVWLKHPCNCSFNSNWNKGTNRINYNGLNWISYLMQKKCSEWFDKRLYRRRTPTYAGRVGPCTYLWLGLFFNREIPTWVTLNLTIFGIPELLYRTKVCRYNWHIAGSLGWPFPALKCKYFSNKINNYLNN